MKRFKLMSLGLVVCTSFVAGQMFAPNANTAAGGTSEDPVVSKTYLNAELGKLKTTITSLETTISTLKSNIKTLQSDVANLQSGSGSSNSGSSNSGSSNSGSSSSGSSSSGSSSSTTYIGTGVITANSLNVRSGAGTSYSVVGSLSKNTKVGITKTSGSWYKIKAGSLVGWVSADYIKLS